MQVLRGWAVSARTAADTNTQWGGTMGKSERTISSRRPALVVRPLLAALAAAGLAMPVAAPAATIQVTTGGDANGTTCTLRRAIESINAGSVQGSCTATGDPFGTNDTVDLTLRSGTITLGGTEIGITKPVILNGPAAGPTVLTISGNNASRVFSVADAANSLTINRLTIANGKAAGSGGCILGGTLESSITVIDVTESIVKSCVAMPTPPADTFETVGVGGGIAGGAVILTRSTVSGNTAVAGGGVFAKYLRSDGSSVSNNTAAGSTCDVDSTTSDYCYLTVFGGGGIFAGSLYAAASSISGNTVNPSTITGENNGGPSTLGIGGGITAFGVNPGVTAPVSGRVAGKSAPTGTATLARLTERAAPAVQAAKAAVAARTGSAAKMARVAAAAQITVPPGKYGAVLANTTVSGNSVAATGAGSEKKYLGGGVFSLGIFASNSTVSGNSVTANGYGSGLFTTNMTLNNSTIAGNAGIGGIVVAGSSGSNFVLRSTLVANNTGPGKDIECPESTCTVTGDTSLVRVPGDGVTLPPEHIVGKDPLLGPLANNGGPVAGAPGDAGTAVIRTMRAQGTARWSTGAAILMAWNSINVVRDSPVPWARAGHRRCRSRRCAGRSADAGCVAAGRALRAARGARLARAKALWLLTLGARRGRPRSPVAASVAPPLQREREVAAHAPSRIDLAQDRRLGRAPRLRHRASRMEAAPGRRIHGTGNLALQHDGLVPLARVDGGVRRQQRRRVRVGRRREEIAGRALVDDLPQIHHRGARVTRRTTLRLWLTSR